MPSALFSDGYTPFVEAVIALRKERGVTQQELARRLGRPQSFVAKSEKRQRRLDPYEFWCIIRALGADPGAVYDAVAKQLADRQGPVAGR